MRQIADAGAKGLLIPDVPLEETYETSKICAKYGIDLVLLSTPTTPTERARQIAPKHERLRLFGFGHRRDRHANQRRLESGRVSRRFTNSHG